jgi:hypothetical protein
MTGIMMNMMNNVGSASSPVYPSNNTWTGTTSGLQINYLNAPTASFNYWLDESGNGRNGTIYKTGTGTATYTSSNNGGLILGPSQATNMAMVANTSYNLAVPFTVEVIANITATSFWSTLFGNESYLASLGWMAYWASSTQISIGGVTSKYNLYNVTANSGAIRQFIITVDATPSLKLYINGTLQNSVSTGYNSAQSPAATGLNFGSRHPNAGTSGTPTDVAIGTYYQMRAYNIALSQAQVTANYNAVKTTYGI